MDLLKWMQRPDMMIDELNSYTKEPLNVASFAAHLLDIVNSKRQPASLGKAVIREFFLKSLGASGMDRRELTRLSDDELDELWNKLPSPRAFAPFPTPYETIPCYSWILTGIAQYGAIEFVARREGLQAFDHNDQEVHKFEGIDQRKALRFIGLADEVLRPYISQFRWNDEETALELNLSKEQITEFKKQVEQDDFWSHLLLKS
ncbi:MAG: hypothetical protein SXV54_16860 [Chloroflexota bacterium]|nr:hypothetical protein [Chloroflexota bacterium]